MLYIHDNQIKLFTVKLQDSTIVFNTQHKSKSRIKTIEIEFSDLGGDNINKIKVLDSVVDAEIKNEINEASWCEDLVQYATYKCDIEGLIAAGYLFCPKVIQIKDYIFIEKFWYFSDDEDKSLDAINKMEKRFNNN